MKLPTSLLGGNPGVRIWGRVSIRRGGKLVPVDRSGHPTFANFFFTDEIKLEFNRSEPAQDRERFLDQMIHSLEHVGGYSRAEARALIEPGGGAARHAELRPRQARRATQTAACSPTTSWRTA